MALVPPPWAKFAIDNVRDGINDQSLIMWPAWDCKEGKEVWVVGRKVEDKVMPLAVMVESMLAVRRYAPRKSEKTEYDFTQVESKIIRP